MPSFPEIKRLGCARTTFEGVIFDFDGTLADSMPVWEHIDLHFCERYGLMLPSDYNDSIVGLGFEGTARYFIEELGLKMSVEECCRKFNELAYEDYRDRVRLKPGAYEYLHRLFERGVPLTIASSLNVKLLTAGLQGNGIEELFPTFNLCDDLATHKNESTIFEAAAASIGIEPERCLVFEDIVPAVRSAQRVGMTAIAVLDKSEAQDSALIKQLADGYIVDFMQLA
jgi:HAD superfamily hydrolase (TIGR01509 family)